MKSSWFYYTIYIADLQAMVNNDEISKILGKIGFLLEMGDENDPNATFKARSYNRAEEYFNKRAI
jgi:hypothetical protein